MLPYSSPSTLCIWMLPTFSMFKVYPNEETKSGNIVELNSTFETYSQVLSKIVEFIAG